ncbi:class I SAM-dependent methyltransferase [Streptomyces sp. M19]
MVCHWRKAVVGSRHGTPSPPRGAPLPSEPDTAHTAHAAHTPDTADTAALAELLDLDAEVMRAHLSEVTAWIEELTAGSPPRHVLDLGSGTGAGVLALLARFGTAEATAVDVDPGMLDRLGEKARARGVADRVRTVRADLDAGWPDVGTADLVWASASCTTWRTPAASWPTSSARSAPAGSSPWSSWTPSPLPPRGRGDRQPGVEARVHAVMDAARAAQMPHVGSDWGTLLADAGFAVEAERIFDIALTPRCPRPPAATPSCPCGGSAPTSATG